MIKIFPTSVNLLEIIKLLFFPPPVGHQHLQRPSHLQIRHRCPDVPCRPRRDYAGGGNRDSLPDVALAEPYRLRDLDLVLSGLLHIGDHFTVFRAEAVLFVVHSQFVVKLAWMNPRLCQSNFYSLTN